MDMSNVMDLLTGGFIGSVDKTHFQHVFCLHFIYFFYAAWIQAVVSLSHSWLLYHSLACVHSCICVILLFIAAELLAMFAYFLHLVW